MLQQQQAVNPHCTLKFFQNVTLGFCLDFYLKKIFTCEKSKLLAQGPLTG